MNIQITTNGFSVEAEIYDTPTGRAVATALPITGMVNRWGGEIYFAIPVSLSLEDDSRDVLEPGELGYWPTGKAFCIFFGATPASQAGECRAASAVNVFGKVTGELDDLWNVADGSPVRIEAR
jgi:hypothetical protein